MNFCFCTLSIFHVILTHLCLCKFCHGRLYFVTEYFYNVVLLVVIKRSILPPQISSVAATRLPQLNSDFTSTVTSGDTSNEVAGCISNNLCGVSSNDVELFLGVISFSPICIPDDDGGSGGGGGGDSDFDDDGDDSSDDDDDDDDGADCESICDKETEIQQ